MKPFPESILPPQTEVVIDGFPGRQIVRKQAPRTAASQQIQDGIENFPRTMKPRTPMSSRCRKKSSDTIPFRIAYIG
jgi:hypothetical protein